MEAVGPISKPLQLLVDLVAASPAFRARVEATTDDEARAHIHWPHLVGEVWEQQLPCAVLMSAGDLKWNHIGTGPGNVLQPGGGIELILADVDRYPDDTKTSQIDFENFVGETLRQIAEQAGISDQLAIASIELLQPAALPDPRERPTIGAFWLTKYIFRWGT